MREVIADIGLYLPDALLLLKTLAVLDLQGARPELLRIATGLGPALSRAIDDLAAVGLVTYSPSGHAIGHPDARELVADSSRDVYVLVVTLLAAQLANREATPAMSPVDVEIVHHLPALVDALPTAAAQTAEVAIAELAENCSDVLVMSGLGSSFRRWSSTSPNGSGGPWAPSIRPRSSWPPPSRSAWGKRGAAKHRQPFSKRSLRSAFGTMDLTENRR